MPPGRPRSFDVEAALDRAVEVFRRHGYEGTSLPMLTRAMGVNRPSLYAAFGNKEALFRRALARYVACSAAYISAAFDQPTARAVADALLTGVVNLVCNPENPRGCLVVQGALVGGENCEVVRNELAAKRKESETALTRRFERAVAEGDLPAYCDPAALSRYIMTVIHGLSVQASSGATREELLRVAAIAMQAWPK